jgi:hypothetical protein
MSGLDRRSLKYKPIAVKANRPCSRLNNGRGSGRHGAK